MTVTSQISTATRSWTGAETQFSAGFRALDATHCTVATATETLVRGTHYTSSLAPSTGELIITPLAGMPAAPQTLTINRVTPALQEDNLANGNSYDAEAQELQADRLIMVAQEARRDAVIARTLSEAAAADAAAILAGVSAGPVQSVNGRGGVVTLGKSDVGLASVDNTPDADKPLSGPQAVALDAKVPANLRILGTVAALAAATIAGTITVVSCLGYTLPIDKGGGTYIEVTNTGPLLAGEVQSNSGTRRWRLNDTRPTQYQFGAAGGFAGDDRAALQAYADYCADRAAIFHLAPGDHNLSAPIVLRPGPVPDPDYNVAERGPTWTLDNNCRIKATAVMDALFQGGNHTYENIIVDGVIQGGVLDCNNLAQHGVWVTFTQKCIVDRVQVRNVPAGGAPYKIGTTVLNEFGTLAQSYEGYVTNCRAFGTPTSPLEASRANTHGIRFINCTDNYTHANLIGGVIVGVWADFTSGWDGQHGDNHFWSHSENGSMFCGYRLYGHNKISKHKQDGPFDYVALFLAHGNNVTQAGINYGGQSADQHNYAALWRLEQDVSNGTTGGLTVTNSHFKATAAKNIAAECSFGPGVPRTAFAKDGTNTYEYVNNLEPVSIGNCLSARVLISGTTPTVQSGSNNVASVVRNGSGNYTTNFIRNMLTTTPISAQVITNGVFSALTVVEATALRTASSATFYVYNSAGTLTDPGGLNISATSWSA